ncbi:hypothetical protein BN946_scf184979.g46 [Trametes cinnabarina]|uniref:NAD-dependent epimerase/dehydratase domain-containing protein n=1 Tax=Pycnoporus cinnabarinus TaxID=5643 RepID=A0A060SJX8_PYCCI|nr:hypothetical protein BN946_scf184979.g46 [Trametes cinnabarina]
MGEVSILLTGATGYVGASILQGLLRHPDATKFEITTLVRDSAKAKILEEKFGVKAALGSVTEQEKLTKLAEDAHVVIHTANSSDSIEAMEAILRGLKNRHENTGDLPHLIQTSGTGVFMDDARGEYASTTIYSDLDLAALDALPPNAFHRAVELLAIDADEKGGYARTYIVSPSLIYGLGHGPLFDAGLANPFTFAIAAYVRAALKRGTVGVLNQGAGIWQSVHIDDVVDLYIRMLDAILSDPEKVSHGRSGYFIAENGGQSARELLQAIAEGLFALRRVATPELFIANVLFSNARCKGERARRELGWTPKYTPRDLLELVKSELTAYVKREDSA